MKKIIALLACLTMLLSMAACAGNETPDTTTTAPTTQATENTTEATEDTTEAIEDTTRENWVRVRAAADCCPQNAIRWEKP
jgi:Flp pilus assembly protein TadD